MNEKQQALMQRDRGVHADLLFMCLPLLAMAMFFYGVRPAIMCLTAFLTANLCDRLAALLRRMPYNKNEWSSEAFAVLFTLMIPASASYYVVVVGSIAAVILGKEAFGGYGAYPFHPTAVGYVVAAVNWPDQMFRYPQPFTAVPVVQVDTIAGALVESPLYTLKTGGLPTLDSMELLLGNYAGPMGLTALLVILACALFLWNRRRLNLLAPVCFLLTCALVAFLAPRLGDIPAMSAPWVHLADRLAVVKYEICGGGMVFAAVYLLADPITVPKNQVSCALYSILLGFMTMMFRYYGNYEVGVCFAMLAVNAVSGWIDRTVCKAMNRKGVVRREY